VYGQTIAYADEVLGTTGMHCARSLYAYIDYLYVDINGGQSSSTCIQRVLFVDTRHNHTHHTNHTTTPQCSLKWKTREKEKKEKKAEDMLHVT